MSEEQWAVVDRVEGLLQAEILSGMMQAQGIRVVLSQESAGQSVFPTNVGTLGAVEILVPAHDVEQARQLLEAYYGQAEEDEAEDEDA